MELTQKLIIMSFNGHVQRIGIRIIMEERLITVPVKDQFVQLVIYIILRMIVILQFL